jgi:hypothetical protein
MVDLNSNDFISGAEVRRLLGNISDKTLERRRKRYWFEGFHYSQPIPEGRIQYIKPMIIHWLLNHGSNPQAHDQMIQEWLTAKDKPPKKRR